MENLKVGIAGLGRIGKIHLNNLLQMQNVDISAAMDPDEEAQKYAKSKGVKLVFKTYKELLNVHEIKALIICTPTDTHADYVELAALAGKHVFCEKPLDLNINKINICKKKISKLNPKIQIGFNRRYDPGHNSLKKELTKGKIGKLEKIIITSRDPAPPSIKYLKQSGGIFRDMMIHDFDLLRFYLGNDDIKSIFAYASNISDKRFNKINDYELASCLLKSKKNVQCVLINSRHCSFGYDQRVELFGSKGMLISGNKKLNETEIYTKNNTSQKKPLLNFFIDRYKEAYKIQLDDLFRMISKKKRPLANFEDGRRALIIANAANKSLKKRKSIKVNFN